MAKKQGLGRGFASLIPTELLQESFDPTADQDEQISDLRHLKVDQITADPDQPRRQFDEIALEELAGSIKEHGIIQPLIVTPAQSGSGYIIVAGERRFRAAKIAGIEKVPVLVRTLTNQHKLELSLIENLQRHDLNDLEIATAYLKLRDQFNLTMDQIAERVGVKNAATISNKIRLLRLPDSVKKLMIERVLTEGQVRPLVNIDPRVIEEILPRIVSESWSARKVEQFVVNYRKEGTKFVKKAAKSAEITPYQNERKRLEKRFHLPVAIKTSARGNGQIVIRFKNDDEFQKLQQLLGGE